ncbi:MAG: hypothetical protein QOD81_3570 [Solirubrobacteraceae bacterium]|nr:hypothetical protein [Solirubrobacteraceae bacterium]
MGRRLRRSARRARAGVARAAGIESGVGWAPWPGARRRGAGRACTPAPTSSGHFVSSSGMNCPLDAPRTPAARPARRRTPSPSRPSRPRREPPRVRARRAPAPSPTTPPQTANTPNAFVAQLRPGFVNKARVVGPGATGPSLRSAGFRTDRGETWIGLAVVCARGRAGRRRCRKRVAVATDAGRARRARPSSGCARSGAASAPGRAEGRGAACPRVRRVLSRPPRASPAPPPRRRGRSAPRPPCSRPPTGPSRRRRTAARGCRAAGRRP